MTISRVANRIFSDLCTNPVEYNQWYNDALMLVMDIELQYMKIQVLKYLDLKYLLGK